MGENNLIDNGIGTNLYSSDIVQETRLQSLYLDHMCVQAGIGSYEDGEPQCPSDRMDARGWTILVRAGFNDIDRRCDAYLAWLNSKRRTNDAVLNQLSQTSTATQSIMRIAGASADPLALAGLAFGLARDTFSNYYSRLLLEVESSTVELVVTENRHKFRGAFNNTLVRFKPDAIHLLRSYLLICTPHVIENNINTRTRFSVSDVDTPPQDNDPAQIRKSIMSNSFLAALPKTPRTTLPRVGGQRGGTRVNIPTLASPNNEIERRLTRTDAQRIQSNLCVTPDGDFQAETRRAIRLAKLGANRGSAAGSAVFTNQRDEITTPTEGQIFLDARPCRFDRSGEARGYANAYEKFRFPNAQSVAALQKQLKRCDDAVVPTGRFDVPTRKAIGDLKSKLTDKAGFEFPNTSQLSDASYNQIVLNCL